MICTYQDFAEEEEPEVDSSALADKGDHEGSEQVVFPAKLHDMLTQVEKEGLGHVVGWAPHGRCFLVRNKNEFVTRILASWFRQSKFASFQRQLNLYGFKRITTGPDKGGYYHELFLRGKAFLCHRIERVKIKGSKPGRIKAYADAEPDFYRMRPMPAEDGNEAAAGEDGASDQAQGQVAPCANDPRAQPPPRHSTATTAVAAVPTGGQRSSPPFIQADERNLALSHQNRLAISFLSDDPQPMTLARNSPPVDDSKEDPSANLKPQARSRDALGASTTATTNALNSMLQPTAVSLSLASNLKQVQDQPPNLNAPNPPQLRLLPHTSTQSSADSSGSSLAHLHPMLQASGQTNLVNLRQQQHANTALFGSHSLVAAQQPPPSFLSLTLPATTEASTLPPVALPLPPAHTSSLGQTGSALPQQQQVPFQTQFPRSLGLSDVQMPMPMLNLPNQLALSQSLPTAQALALEDLFDNGDATVAAAAALVVNTGNTGLLSPQPLLQQQQQQQQPQQQQQRQQIQQQAMPLPPPLPQHQLHLQSLMPTAPTHSSDPRSNTLRNTAAKKDPPTE